MNAPAPTFRPIDLTKVKRAVKEVTEEANIPRLAYPDETPTTVPAESIVSTPIAKKAPRKAGSPGKMVRTAVDLPDYLLKAVAKESVEKGVTKRFLYLSAFRAAGFMIHDIDMQEDGRRDTGL